MCVCRQSVCSGCGCLSPCIRLLSPPGLLAFQGSPSSCPAFSVSRLKVDALVDKGGTLQDLVQPQMLPEASLLLPLPFFPPFPPSLPFPFSLPPKAGVPGGGTCQSLAVPLPLPAQGAAPPGSQVFGSQETLQAPGEAVKLRTPQTPLRSPGEYIWEDLGGAVLSWVQKHRGPLGQGRDKDEMEMGVDSGEGRWPGRGLEAKRAL